MDTARANVRIASSVFLSASWRRASSVKRSDAASAGVAALVISGAREALKSGPALTVLTSRAGGGEAELSAELPGDAEGDAGASGLAGGTSAAPSAAEVPPPEAASTGGAPSTPPP